MTVILCYGTHFCTSSTIQKVHWKMKLTQYQREWLHIVMFEYDPNWKEKMNIGVSADTIWCFCIIFLLCIRYGVNVSVSVCTFIFFLFWAIYLCVKWWQSDPNDKCIIIIITCSVYLYSIVAHKYTLENTTVCNNKQREILFNAKLGTISTGS